MKAKKVGLVSYLRKKCYLVGLKKKFTKPFLVRPGKGTRLDGFTIVVFEECWNVIKEDF